jgi:hypothetical protein
LISVMLIRGPLIADRRADIAYRFAVMDDLIATVELRSNGQNGPIPLRPAPFAKETLGKAKINPPSSGTIP